jgi:hypothetical protein
MKKSAWDRCQDVEAMVRFASQHVSRKELLSLATDYCQEVLSLVPGQIALRLLEVARDRVKGADLADALKSVRTDSDALYQQLYPGYGAPSPAALALTALGELVFTQDETQAAVTALTTAAEAKAVAAGLAVSDVLYDQAHDAEIEQECRRQVDFIRSRVNPFV